MSGGEAVNRGPQYLCGWMLVFILISVEPVACHRGWLILCTRFLWQYHYGRRGLNMGNGWFCDVNRRLSFEQVINSILCKLWWIGHGCHFKGSWTRLKVAVFSLWVFDSFIHKKIPSSNVSEMQQIYFIVDNSECTVYKMDGV